MLGLSYVILTGLSINYSKEITANLKVDYNLEGVVLMNLISFSFVVGNSALGVFSELEEEVCCVKYIGY